MSIISTGDPIGLFGTWFEQAQKAEPFDATAMTLATVSKSGRARARMVLLKEFSERGFVFYTNLGSRKADDLQENPHAALCFHWPSQSYQVRVEGSVLQVSDKEADAYFASRPRLSQIGAWASKQSRPMEGRFELEKRVAEFTAKFGVKTIPRPEFWTGFCLIPERIEFWCEKKFRLHDRVEYIRTEKGWQAQALYP